MKTLGVLLYFVLKKCCKFSPVGYNTIMQVRLKELMLSAKAKAWIGLDGFVDKIVQAVKERKGMGRNFIPFNTLSELGEKIQQASKSNLNIELYPKIEKMGGNGPLLANTLANFGVDVSYVGTLGEPIHSVFQAFCQKTKAMSLGMSGKSSALEFSDGKLILGNTYPMDAITYALLTQKIPEDELIRSYSESLLISWQNWTMILNMNDILEKILEHVWPHIKDNEERICFFDLADPAKRCDTDVYSLLNLLPRFKRKAKVYLGVNRSEVKHIGFLLKLPPPANEVSHVSYLRWVESIRQALNIDGVFMHCCDGAIASCLETVFVPALKAKKLTCLTGSGDHFNGGMLSGLLMNLSLEQSLLLGHIASVLYIETGITPTLDVVQDFYEKIIKQRELL